jgi:hypothetical protein
MDHTKITAHHFKLSEIEKAFFVIKSIEGNIIKPVIECDWRLFHKKGGELCRILN